MFKALFFRQLLELGNHLIDRTVVAGRLRVNQRDQPARCTRKFRHDACGKAERCCARACLQECAAMHDVL
ncbi:hypothetical protein D3C71_1691400 [compost metagenome]